MFGGAKQADRPMPKASSNKDEIAAAFDVVIVGAGFSGLYMLHRTRGLGLSAIVFDAAAGVGGTWYWNRYPGARVDVESQEYSYSFSPELEEEWQWSERYSSQPEILRYLNHVADRFDLRRDIRLETRVTAAHYDEARNRWRIETDRGDRVSARFCILATGCLSVPNDSPFPGAERFAGPIYHTGRWPHDPVDFTGKIVGVIGTGSSGIQVVSEIAKQAAHLYVFQRTPNYSVPAHNGPMNPDVAREWRANRVRNRQDQRQTYNGMLYIRRPDVSALEVSADERRRVYEERWAGGGFRMSGAFKDIALNPEANATIAAFVADKIRGIVRDPQVAEKLIPKTHPFGTKRLCIDTGYYATFNRDNVTLVDVAAAPILEIAPAGLKTAERAYELDSIVCATGFDAMTGAINNIDIRGRGGSVLKEKWSDGPRTYLGLMVAGFPNLFTITGPGSPSVLSNVAVSIEQHVEWVSDCLAYLGERQLSVIEATAEAQDAWVAHVNEVAEKTLYPLANSWYMGANIPGKPRVFMPYIGGVGVYRRKCEEIAAKGYEGFALSPAGNRLPPK
jgi:cyclohexanone monooxygenase